MKANQSIKQLKPNNTGYVKIVGGLVALLLMIIVGVLVYYSVSDDMIESSSTETFTYTTPQATNADLVVTLSSSPSSITKVWIHNSTSGASHANVTTGITTNFKTVTVAHAGIAAEYNHAVVYYVSNTGADADSTGDMASTIFSLLPIIALAVVASIIIGVIIGFGGSKKGL